MSPEDEYGAQKLAVIIVSMLAFTTLLCYRICLEDRNRKKLQALAPIETEPSQPYSIVIQSPRTTSITTTPQSDSQLIFGATSSNISTPATDALASSINQQMLRRGHLTDLQNELERRAEERRENLERSTATDLCEHLPVPPYSSKDESLPSYDQAVKIQVYE